MDRIVIPWRTGTGYITISEANGEILISSDANDGVEREQQLTFRTLTGNATATLTVIQKGGRIVLRDSNMAVLRDNSQNILTAKN